MDKIKILGIFDHITPTGFSTVSHNIFGRLHPDKYSRSVLAINYRGDPHPLTYRIYPASLKGDIYGFNRVSEVCNIEKPDIIFMVNDAWILDNYLGKIKEAYGEKPLPSIVTYVPVDAKDHDPDWYSKFGTVKKLVAYTQFGKDVIQRANPSLQPLVIPHGVDTQVFFKMDKAKDEIKKLLYPTDPTFYEDSFIVLNANRNQPRKRIDITIRGFALFAENKPDNVKLYLHMGVRDSHVDLLKLAKRYGIDRRLVLTNLSDGVQRVGLERLNLIYNSTDLGINTGVGEGWSLTQIEHAVTGAPQVVAGHSALIENYSDCGVIIPTSMDYTLDMIMTVGELVRPEDVAEKLEVIYRDKELYNVLSAKSIQKFTSPKYSWDTIAQTWDQLFTESLS